MDCCAEWGMNTFKKIAIVEMKISLFDYSYLKTFAESE
jgi:hypothetical protein